MIWSEHFSWREHLATGGMSEVFEGVHKPSGTAMVLKVWSSERAPSAMSTFTREAQAIARLSHQDIVCIRELGAFSAPMRLHGIACAEGSPFIISDRAPGVALSSLILARQPWRAERAVALVLRALRALAHAHARGVLHRDIKPGNMIIDPERDDALTLIDFGLAGLTHAAIDATGGTPLYLAPEQLDANHSYGQGPWTDIFALGCVLHELLSGVPAFTGLDFAQIHEAKLSGWSPAANLFQETPAPLLEWLHTALATRPAARYSSAAAAAAALEYLAASATCEDSAPLPAPDNPTLVDHAAPGLFESSFFGVVDVAAANFEDRGDLNALLPGNNEAGIPDVPFVASAPERATSRALYGTELGIVGLKVHDVCGRQEEKRVLWERLHAPNVPPTLLFGAPGVGKSALARWLGQRANEHYGSACLRVHFEHTRDDARSWVMALNQWLGLTGLPPRFARERVRQRAGAMGITSRPQLELLESLTSTEHLDSWSIEHVATALCAVASGRARSSAKTRPSILILEDLHASTSSASLLERIEDQEGIFVLGTCRPEPTWLALARERTWRDIELGRISDDALRLLLTHTLELREDVVEHVLARADGLPLYALQLVQDLAEQDQLVCEQEGFAFRADTPPDIPGAVVDLCLRRLERLEENNGLPEDFLETAACLGESILVNEWQKLVEQTDVPRTGLDALRRHHIIHDIGDEVRFDHAMLAESLLARASGANDSEARVCALHTRCLELVREVSGDQLDASTRLFNHALAIGDFETCHDAARNMAVWRPAELAEPALDRLETQLEPAAHFDLLMSTINRVCSRINSMRLREVPLLLERARHHLDALAETHPDYHRACEQFHFYCFAHARYVNDLDEARKIYRAHLQNPLATQTRHSVHRMMLDISCETDDLERAIWHAERAVESAPDDEWSRGWLCYDLMGLAKLREDHEQLQEHFTSARACFLSVKDHSGIGAIHEYLGLALFERGEHAGARTHLEEAIEAYALAGDRSELLASASLLRLGFLDDMLDDLSGDLGRLMASPDYEDVAALQSMDLSILADVASGRWEDARARSRDYLASDEYEHIDLLARATLRKAASLVPPARSELRALLHELAAFD